jgi:hypothetical protein
MPVYLVINEVLTKVNSVRKYCHKKSIKQDCGGSFSVVIFKHGRAINSNIASNCDIA